MISLGPSLKKKLKKSLSGGLFQLFACLSESIEASFRADRVLILAPHPDDETLGCGAFIIHLKNRGASFRIVTVTDGAASTVSQSLNPEDLKALRRKESAQAIKRLGLAEEDLIFLGYPDGGASEQIGPIAADIAEQLGLYAPDLLLAPFGADLHPDHRAVAEALSLLRQEKKIACRVLCYPMWFWPREAIKSLWRFPFLIKGRKLDARPYLKAKRAAFEAYRSQQENLTGESGWSVLEEDFIEQNFRPWELFFEDCTNERSGLPGSRAVARSLSLAGRDIRCRTESCVRQGKGEAQSE